MRENVETHGVRLRRAEKPAEMCCPFLRDATFETHAARLRAIRRISRNSGVFISTSEKSKG
jgi:hypothetical protein